MKRSRQADPLEPERHQRARVEVSSNHSRDRGSTMNITTYGLDLAKRVFQVHWVELETGEVKRKALARADVGLNAGMEREAQVRTEPNLRARRVALMWQQLEARQRSLTFEQFEARSGLEQRFKEMTGELKRDPQIESILRERQRQLGIGAGSRLDWVIHARTLEHALNMPTRGLGR